MWLGKPAVPTRKLLRAVLANAVRPVHQENQVRTDAMDNRAGTATRARLEKMQPKKRNCCPFHLSASAWPSLVQPDPSVRKDQMDHLANLVAMEAMAHLAHKDHLDHLVHLVLMVTTARLVQGEKTDT